MTSQADKKRELFRVQIRRQQKQNHFRKIREQLISNYELIHEMEEFMRKEQPIIPDQIAQMGFFISCESFNRFLQLLMTNVFSFIRCENSGINTWFLDCMEVNNLKYFAELCRNERANHLFGNFFHSTLNACKQYNEIQLKLLEESKKSNCIISSIQSELGLFLQALKESQIQTRVLALLDFWGAYIGKTEDSILISNFSMCLNIFEFFFENLQIKHQKQPYYFVKNIMGYIIKMKIFDEKNQNVDFLITIREQCERFVKNISKRLPFLFQTSVLYSLNLPELGEILIKFDKLQQYKKGIFRATIFPCDYFRGYLFSLLKPSFDEKQTYQGKIVGMHLIDILEKYNLSYSVLNLTGVLTITKIFAHEFIIEPETQIASIIVLYNIVHDDGQKRYEQIMENVPYRQIFESKIEGNDRLLDIYEFLVMIVNTYPENKVIHDQLLLECNLEEKMRNFYSQKQDQYGYIKFTLIVLRNIEFFMENYWNIVDNMINSSMSFDQLDELRSRVIEEFRMKGVTYEQGAV